MVASAVEWEDTSGGGVGIGRGVGGRVGGDVLGRVRRVSSVEWEDAFGRV